MIIAGVDEAGRGALAGPVFAAAVVLDPEKPIKGLADSKTLPESVREMLAAQIEERALAWAVGQASVEEIDQINILQASLLAMQRAVAALTVQPECIKVDGREAPIVACRVETIIKGDALEPAISAASILAKVYRDRAMKELDKQYPHYEFAKHKGYGTAMHLRLLSQHGACEIHRRSYAPVQSVLE